MAVLLVSGGTRAGSFPGSPWAGSGFTDSYSLISSHAPEGAGQWAWDTPDWGSLDLSSRDISGNVDRALLDEARALFDLTLANPNLGRSTPETLGYPVSERSLARAWQYAVDRGAVPSMVDRVFSQARTRLVQQFADAATRLRELDAYNSSIEGRVRRAVEIGYYTPGATVYGLAEVAGVNPFLRGVTGGEITPVLGFREVGLAERGMGLAEMAMMAPPLRGTGYADDVYRGSKGLWRAPKSTVWNPVNGPGPLGADAAKTFRSATYRERVIDHPLDLYRVYGGKSGQLGPYWTTTKPAGGFQSQLDSALLSEWGNAATNTARIRVPSGTRIFEGAAAPQTGQIKTFENLIGGGNQVYIPRVNPSWLVK